MSPNVQQPGMENNGAMNSANGMNGMTSAAQDRMFVKKALEGSMGEVQMGQLALQKSNDEQVKQFAQRMVDDHGKMMDEMKPVAQQMGVKVPDSPDKSSMKTVDKMKNLSGDAFDQAYIKDMVKDHKGDDSDFKREAESTQNPQLKEMVMKGEQTIQSHLLTIQKIQQSKGAMASK